MQSINCAETTQQLDAYHDGELNADERASIEKHLHACPPCIARLREIDRVAHTLKSLTRPAFPSSLSGKLDRLIDTASQPKVPTVQPRKVLSFRPALIAPIAVAAVSLALVIAFKFMAPVPSIIAGKPPAEKNGVAQMHSVNAPTESQRQIAQEQIGQQGTAEEAASKHMLRPPSPVIAILPHPLAIASRGGGQPMPERIAAVTKPPSAPVTAPAAVAETADSEVADLPTTSPSLNDTLGIATDEDGLYDIKM